MLSIAPIVLNAIVSSLTAEGQGPSPPISASTSVASQSQAAASSSSSSALDMLTSILANKDPAFPFPPELRANVCSLILQLERGKSHEGVDSEKIATLKEETSTVLKEAVETSTGVEENGKPGGKVFVAAAKRVLEVYQSSGVTA